MNQLSGKYHYRSFCPKAGTKDTPSEIAAPWTPPGVFTVETDATGKVKGKLSFGPGSELQVSGSLTASAGTIPEGIQLTGEGLGATYKIRGFFLDGSDHIVGTVIAIANDVAKQPVGAHGPFILYP